MNGMLYAVLKDVFNLIKNKDIWNLAVSRTFVTCLLKLVNDFDLP